MDMLVDQEHINKLAEASEKLQRSKVLKLYVNYEWSEFGRYRLGETQGSQGNPEQQQGMQDNEDQDEKAVAKFVQFCPPSRAVFRKFSVNFLRLLYAESYANPNFVQATVEYDSQQFENSGIGGTLKEWAYKSQRFSFLYGVFGFFVGKQRIFRFDHTVLQLEQEYKRESFVFFFLQIIFIFLLLLTS